MKQMILKILLLCFLPSFAAANLGGVANNLMAPVSLLSNFITSACFLIGGSFLFASLIKYIEHRRSPTMVPISTVVFLIIAGLLLIIIPFAYMVIS